MDVETIDSGDVFPARIERSIRAAHAVLVVIGPSWLDTLNERAAQAKQDYLRREVILAVKRRIAGEELAVIPVLMGGAEMPSRVRLASGLPPEIHRLLEFQAHVFQGSQADWDHQFVRLRERLAVIPGVPTPRFRLPTGVEQPYAVDDDLLSFHFQDPRGWLPVVRALLEADNSCGNGSRVAVHGMGGVGKTQLALKYTLDYRDLYPGVWWFRAESDSALQIDALKRCEEVGVFVPDGESAARALKRWLERQERGWLLVFENATGPDGLHHYLPQGAAHHVLITSRSPVWGSLAVPLRLDLWTKAEGSIFLMDRLPDMDKGDSSVLSESLGGLPLALEQAASYLEATGTTARRYGEMLENVAVVGDILDSDVGHSGTGYERSVTNTLTVALRELSLEARTLLGICAFAAPAPIPEWVIRSATDELPSDLGDAVDHDLSWNRIVAEIRCYGLVRRVTTDSGDRTEHSLVLHRLTQRAVRLQLAVPREACSTFLALLNSAFGKGIARPDHGARVADLVPHAIQLDRSYQHGYLHPEEFARFLRNATRIMRIRPALYSDCARMLRRIVEILDQTFGSEDPITLTAMNDLAWTLGEQGNLASARKIHESVSETFCKVLGPDHASTLNSFGNLAVTLLQLGDLAGARSLHERVVENLRRALGPEHPDTLMRMGTLAITLAQQGDLENARRIQESVAEASSHILGPDHPDAIRATANLAATLTELGKLEQARRLQESVLNASRRVFGSEHQATLACMGNLATTLTAKGDLASAKDLERQALETARRVLGPNHPETLKCMGNYATTLSELGDLNAAREFLEGALEASKCVLGEKHPESLVHLVNLGVIIREQGDAIGSRELLRHAMEISQAEFGEEYPGSVKCMEQLAVTLKACGDKAGASKLRGRLQEIRHHVGE